MEWLWPSLAFACSITNINYRYPQKFTDFYDVIAAKSESPVDFFLLPYSTSFQKVLYFLTWTKSLALQ